MTAVEPQAQTPAAEVITRVSPWSVGDTVARLSAVVAAQGLKLFAVIDHSAEAAACGRVLRDTKVVMFGCPEADAALIDDAPPCALDLPIRVLVWADWHMAKVSYAAPAALATRYRLSHELAESLTIVDRIVSIVIDR